MKFVGRQLTTILLVCGLFIGCAGPAGEEESGGTPIAEPGLIPVPAPDASTGPEIFLDGRARVKVSPGRVRSVGYAVGLEGNVTPTFRSAKGVRIGVDLTVSGTTVRQTR